MLPAISTAEFYGLTHAQAAKILQRAREAISRWRTVATNHRLPRAEIERMAQAFSLPPVGS